MTLPISKVSARKLADPQFRQDRLDRSHWRRLRELLAGTSFRRLSLWMAPLGNSQ